MILIVVTLAQIVGMQENVLPKKERIMDKQTLNKLLLILSTRKSKFISFSELQNVPVGFDDGEPFVTLCNKILSGEVGFIGPNGYLH